MLTRVGALIARLCGVSCTLRGASYLLHRLGFTPRVPVRRAAERDEAKIAGRRSRTWSKVRDLSAATRARICFEGRVRAGAAAAGSPLLGPPRAHPGYPRGSQWPA
jgi:hypothetical protein